MTTPCETDCSISIHAPTRGATISQAPNGNIYIFQSTLPQGERQTITSATEVVQNISIHAPTRGATYCFYDTARLLYISIHAPTRGATKEYRPSEGSVILFQSTLPQGERQRPGGTAWKSSYFNPRSHKGSDLHTPGLCFDRIKFQSTLPQGERLTYTSIYQANAIISIHAPTRGATAILHKIPYLFYFIFTNPFPISYFHTQPASDF